MDGNQKPLAQDPKQPASPAASRTVYNPPSLTEPSVATVVAPSSEVPAVAKIVTEEPIVRKEAETSLQDASADNDQSAEGFYRSGDDESETTTPRDTAPKFDTEAVEWTSDGEAFQAHAGNWRTRMIVLSVVGGVLIFAITRSYLTAAVVAVAGVLFAVLGSRAPRPISYRVESRGIIVGRRQFSYANFRAFSVSSSSTPTINLMPLKRFAPIMVLRFEPTMAEKIVQVLSSHLPMEAARNDAVDALANKIRI